MISCRRCPSTLRMIVQIAAVVVVLAFLWWFGKRKAKKSNRKVVDVFLSRLKIVIGFYQVTAGTFEAFAYMKWPAYLADFGKFTAAIQLNVFQIAPLPCMKIGLRVNTFDNMTLMIGFNLSIVVVAVLVYLLRCAFIRGKRDMERKQQQAALSETRVTLYRNVILLIFIIFPGTCSSITRSIPCHEVCQTENDTNCRSYLRADYSIECNASYTFRKRAAYGSMMYLILLPALAFIVLFRHFRKPPRKHDSELDPMLDRSRCPIFDESNTSGNNCTSAITVPNSAVLVKNENRNQFESGESELVQAMTFLFENYDSKSWYWELLETIRKVILVSCLILIGEESRAYVGLGSIISGLYAILFAIKQPMVDDFENKIQMLSLTVTFVNLATGVIMKIPQESAQYASDPNVDNIVVEVLLVVVNLSVIFALVGKYLVTLAVNFWEWRNNPTCSAECCLAMIQPMTELGGTQTSMSATNFELYRRQQIVLKNKY